LPIIDPIGREVAEERGLAPVLDSFAELGDTEAIFPRILGHAPGYAEAIWEAMDRGRGEGGVDRRLKEIIRIQLARTAQDPYFASLRSSRAIAAGLVEERVAAGSAAFEDDPHFSPAEKWALRYAYLMYRRPAEVDQSFYEEGKKHFTEAQIMELGGMIAIHYGMQVFMRTLEDR